MAFLYTHSDCKLTFLKKSFPVNLAASQKETVNSFRLHELFPVEFPWGLYIKVVPVLSAFNQITKHKFYVLRIFREKYAVSTLTAKQLSN